MIHIFRVVIVLDRFVWKHNRWIIVGTGDIRSCLTVLNLQNLPCFVHVCCKNEDWVLYEELNVSPGINTVFRYQIFSLPFDWLSSLSLTVIDDIRRQHMGLQIHVSLTFHPQRCTSEWGGVFSSVIIRISFLEISLSCAQVGWWCWFYCFMCSWDSWCSVLFLRHGDVDVVWVCEA